MARHFTSASTEHLSGNHTTAITGYPFSVTGWFKLSSLTADMAFWSYAFNTIDYSYILCWFDGNATDLVALTLSDVDAVTFDTITTTTIADNNWHHIAAAFTSTSSRAFWLDGGNKATSSVDIGVVTNRASIGRYAGATPTFYFDGDADDFAVWDGVALGDDEVAALAAGVSPKSIASGNLVAYYPLDEASGTAHNYIGPPGLSVTETGTIERVHPGPPTTVRPRMPGMFPLLDEPPRLRTLLGAGV